MQSPAPSPRASLADKTDDWFARANAALLRQVPCRAGCSHCCVGPFPITLLDVDSLQEGLKSLSPDQRKRIERRAREQISALETAYPRLRRSRYLDRWPDTDIDRLSSDFHDAPCPALGENGLCALYDYRPLTCRSMGIPTDESGIANGACEVQTFVPIVRLSATLRAEEDALAQQEARALQACRSMAETEGEELLSPYGFLLQTKSEAQEKFPTLPANASWTGDKTLC
jgi:Fe-S-cluster containining protein